MKVLKILAAIVLASGVGAVDHSSNTVVNAAFVDRDFRKIDRIMADPRIDPNLKFGGMEKILQSDNQEEKEQVLSIFSDRIGAFNPENIVEYLQNNNCKYIQILDIFLKTNPQKSTVLSLFADINYQSVPEEEKKHKVEVMTKIKNYLKFKSESTEEYLKALQK